MVSFDVSNKLLISLHYDLMYAVEVILYEPSKNHEGLFPVGFTGASSIDSNPAERDKTFKTPNTHLKENMMHCMFFFLTVCCYKKGFMVKPIFKQAMNHSLFSSKNQ